MAGQGLEGDRHFAPDGAGPGEGITLIAAEALEGLRADVFDGHDRAGRPGAPRLSPPRCDHRTMPGRARIASQAAAEAATLQAAREAAGSAARGAGSSDPLVGDLRRAGLLPLLVLHFASQEPAYGNRLIERIADLTGGALAVNPNTMYPLLRSLEGQGLLSGEWEHPERRSRRFYRVTPEGSAERDRLAAQLGPRLDRISRSIDAIRREILGSA